MAGGLPSHLLSTGRQGSRILMRVGSLRDPKESHGSRRPRGYDAKVGFVSLILRNTEYQRPNKIAVLIKTKNLSPQLLVGDLYQNIISLLIIS